LCQLSLDRLTSIACFQITESLDLSCDNLGLNNIKFLLDESGDIIWFNDLFSIQLVSVNDDHHEWLSKSMADDEKSGNESADILFSCETFEIIEMDQQASLLFRSFTGHHIEFRTGIISQLDSQMILKCEGEASRSRRKKAVQRMT